MENLTPDQIGLYCFMFLLGLGVLAILVAVIKTMLKGAVVLIMVGLVIACGWVGMKGLEMIGIVDHVPEVPNEIQQHKLGEILKDKFNE